MRLATHLKYDLPAIRDVGVQNDRLIKDLAVDDNGLDIRLLGGSWCCDDQRFIGSREVEGDLVEERSTRTRSTRASSKKI